MKTARDPRHQHRIDRMQKLFSVSFNNPDDNPEIANIVTHLPEIDQKIASSAPEWPLEKIAKVDLAILRLATYELTIESKEPEKVIIDEAVELAKAYGNPNSPGFINGALGALVKSKTW
jgi:N utilization substance protein B